jgi:hypothetical protein
VSDIQVSKLLRNVNDAQANVVGDLTLRQLAMSESTDD